MCNRTVASFNLKRLGLFKLCQQRALHNTHARVHLHAVQSMSCSSLLSDLRTAQQEKAAAEKQLDTAQAAAATQRRQHEQEVSHAEIYAPSQDAIANPLTKRPWPSLSPAQAATCTRLKPQATL
jgi:hypothetical protein